jgi:hypothetical protein
MLRGAWPVRQGSPPGVGPVRVSSMHQPFGGRITSLNRPTFAADTGQVGSLRPHDLVEFVGPPSAVLKWPAQGERGVVRHMCDGTVHVVWERSTLVVAWPAEWIAPSEDEPGQRDPGSWTQGAL